MNATQVANKATDWRNKNLNPSKLAEMTGRIEIVNE
jgi:hypothetical protein